MTKMIAIFRVFYYLRYWQRTNGGQMGEFMGNQGIGQMGQMGQMEDKWADKWGKMPFGINLVNRDKWESVYL